LLPRIAFSSVFSNSYLEKIRIILIETLSYTLLSLAVEDTVVRRCVTTE